MADKHVPSSESPTVPPEPRKDGVAAGRSNSPEASATGGQQIGPYRILSHLGAGGFGAVYLAEQLEPVRRRVAIKIVKPGMDSRAVVSRFEAERQALVMMDHPSIARMFDAGVTPEGRPYFAMEYVAGESIARFCEHEGLTIDDRVRLMVKVCRAVHHAHMKGIIHRDLKPGNILVEVVEGKPEPKVIDFGVAKALHGSLTDSAFVTEHGQMIGTPEYMPPEQARGTTADIDTRADVYGLGAVLYELLTGTTPLDSAGLRSRGYAEIQLAIEQEVPTVPSKRRARDSAGSAGGEAGGSRGSSRESAGRGRIPRELDWIVMRCLEKERARRYESAAALARDLERYLNTEAVDAGPPSMSYRALKFVRRHKVAVGAAVFCVLAGVGTIVTTSWALNRAIEDRAAATKSADAAAIARDEAEVTTAFLTGMLESASPGESGRDVTVVQILDDAAKRLEMERSQEAAGRKDTVLPEARIRQTLGSTYLALGKLDKAAQHLPKAVELREAQKGVDAPETLRAKFNLAALWYERERLSDAKALYLECLDGWRKLQMPDDGMVVGALNNLAQIAQRERRLVEAEAIQRDAYARMEVVLGANHPHTLGALTNLGTIMELRGDMKAAESILQEAETKWKMARGSDDPGTLLAVQCLALLYSELGRLDEAEIRLRQVLETRTRVLGEDHIDTIGAMVNLGLVLDRKGDPEAEKFYQSAWERARAVMGESHPTTITAALNLMGVYEAKGWPESSRERVTGLLATMRMIAAREDASADDLNGCAWMMLTVEPESLRDAASAVTIATRACDTERRLGGAHLWEYLDTLALAHSRTGSMASAVTAQREAISRIPSDPASQAYLGEMQERLAAYEAGKPQ